MYINGSRIISILHQWIKTLSKAIGKQQHGMNVREILANELPTETVLKNTHLQGQRVDNVILNLASLFDSKVVKLLTAYAASLLPYKIAKDQAL